MTSANDTATPPRATVRIPTASGDEIEAWVYRPEGEGPHPAVVMAHGFAAVKAGGLQPFAERFSREGFTAIAFDYRQWGGSSGQPREEVSVPRQREDYRTVIDWAIADPQIDATQIFIWGTSFSGLHAVEIAATDTRLRGAIAQNPLVDGLAGTRMAEPTRLVRLFAVGVLDRLGSLLGRQPRYVPAGVAAGQFGAVANAAAFAGLDIIRPRDGSEWHNRVAARSLLGHRRPPARAKSGRYPLSDPARRRRERHHRPGRTRAACGRARPKSGTVPQPRRSLRRVRRRRGLRPSDQRRDRIPTPTHTRPRPISRPVWRESRR